MGLVIAIQARQEEPFLGSPRLIQRPTLNPHDVKQVGQTRAIIPTLPKQGGRGIKCLVCIETAGAGHGYLLIWVGGCLYG